MNDSEWLAERFENHRPRLRSVAYRMLGSLTEADDAVQDAWERASRAGADEVENLGGWLTTIVARVCLNKLRSRNIRREDSLEAVLPDPIVTPEGPPDPEEEALLADSVGLALQIVLDTLSPPERLAFVLHDMFDLTFDEIGPMVGRTSQATRQLASRARRRIKGAGTATPERDPARQRAVVDAFFAAGRAGDFDALVAVLHPDVLLRADFSPGHPSRSGVFRGVEAVTRQARGANRAAEVHPALVNGSAGAVITLRGRPFAVMGFTVAEGKVVEIDAIGDPERVRRVAAAVLGGQ
ncbi:MAG: sigma-70 family RNA polymerase sigma factor [Acidimicrobiales bacterium]